MERAEERRTKFFPTISLGSALATLTFIASAAGVYSQLYADVRDSKVEIANIKVDQIKKEAADRESRSDVKQEIRDVKVDVKEIRQDIQTILKEVRKK